MVHSWSSICHILSFPIAVWRGTSGLINGARVHSRVKGIPPCTDLLVIIVLHLEDSMMLLLFQNLKLFFGQPIRHQPPPLKQISSPPHPFLLLSVHFSVDSPASIRPSSLNCRSLSYQHFKMLASRLSRAVCCELPASFLHCLLDLDLDQVLGLSLVPYSRSGCNS